MEILKIVIADDAKVNNEMMELHLKKCENIEIVGVAEDGAQEYELIKKFHPDLVITDNQMPNMTGCEVIKKIKDDNIEKKPQFIIVSSDSFRDLDYNNLNIMGIVDKPVNYDRIISMITELIDSKNATEADINELENCSTSKRKRSFFNKLFNK